MKALLALFICLILSLSGYARQKKDVRETLMETLEKHPTQDTIRLKTYLNLSREYQGKEVDSNLKYSLLAHDLAERLKFIKFRIIAKDNLGQAYYASGRLIDALSIFKEEEKLTTDLSEKSQAIRNQGNIYIELGRPKDALARYDQSLALAYESKHLLSISLSLANIAYVHRQQGNYEEAVKRLIESIKIAEQLKNTQVLAGIHIQLAMIQFSRNVYADALQYASTALKNYEQINRIDGIATAYTIIGGAHSGFADYEKAKHYFQKAYEMNKRLGDMRQIGGSAQSLAETELRLNQFDKALNYANEAIQILSQLKHINNLIISYTTRGKIYIAIQDLPKANEDLQKALRLSQEGKYKALEKKALDALALLRAAEGNHALAFDLMVQGVKLHDSVLNETNSKQINELKTRYETEKKQQEISLLNEKTKLQALNIHAQQLELDKQDLLLDNQQLELNNTNLLLSQKENAIQQKNIETETQKKNIQVLKQETEIQQLRIQQRNTLLVIISLLLIGGIGLVYLIQSRKKVRTEMRYQEELHKQQEETIKAVLSAEENERTRIAGDLHDGVGQLLSAALMNMNSVLSLQDQALAEIRPRLETILEIMNESYDEMRVVSHQMMPNALIKAGLTTAVKDFINKIDQQRLKISLETVGIHNRMDHQIETVLYRVIQETVNNVIKHAGATWLNIQFLKDEDGVSITIEDNGKGFDFQTVNKEEGIGIRNMTSRIAFLKGTIEFDTAPGRGTLVAIHIPS